MQWCPALQRLLSLAGWEANYIDLDLSGTQPIVEIKLTRSDGRWLWARVDRIGRGTIETFQRERALRLNPSTSGLRPLTPTVEDRFLGRQRFNDAVAMLRSIGSYIGLNSASPADPGALQHPWEAILDAAQALKLPSSG